MEKQTKGNGNLFKWYFEIVTEIRQLSQDQITLLESKN